MRRMAFCGILANLFHRRQWDLLSDYAFNLSQYVVLAEVPEDNLTSYRYGKGILIALQIILENL